MFRDKNTAYVHEYLPALHSIVCVIICRFQVQHCFTWSVKFVTILSHLTQGKTNPAKKKLHSTSAFLTNLASELHLHSYLAIHVCFNFSTGQTPPKVTTFTLFDADETYFTLKYIKITLKCSVISLEITIIFMYGRKFRQVHSTEQLSRKRSFVKETDITPFQPQTKECTIKHLHFLYCSP